MEDLRFPLVVLDEGSQAHELECLIPITKVGASPFTAWAASSQHCGRSCRNEGLTTAATHHTNVIVAVFVGRVLQLWQLGTKWGNILVKEQGA